MNRDPGRGYPCVCQNDTEPPWPAAETVPRRPVYRVRDTVVDRVYRQIVGVCVANGVRPVRRDVHRVPGVVHRRARGDLLLSVRGLPLRPFPGDRPLVPAHRPAMPREDIQYSSKYEDDEYIYRHVILPNDMAKLVPRTHLMTETEWRNLGIQMTSGWVHYMRYNPEPHIIPFRRSKKCSAV